MGYAIVGRGLGFSGDVLAGYMARVVLVIGLSTLLQAVMGHGLSMISDPILYHPWQLSQLLQ